MKRAGYKDRSALQQIADDEAFERLLAAESTMTPEEKRKRFAAIANSEGCKYVANPYAEDGSRFDVLEPETDLPITPDCGSIMPSQRMFGMRF